MCATRIKCQDAVVSSSKAASTTQCAVLMLEYQQKKTRLVCVSTFFPLSYSLSAQLKAYLMCCVVKHSPDWLENKSIRPRAGFSRFGRITRQQDVNMLTQSMLFPLFLLCVEFQKLWALVFLFWVDVLGVIEWKFLLLKTDLTHIFPPPLIPVSSTLRCLNARKIQNRTCSDQRRWAEQFKVCVQ